jgi:hypothetical protein
VSSAWVNTSKLTVDNSNGLVTITGSLTVTGTTGQITSTQFNGPLNGNASTATTAATATNSTRAVNTLAGSGLLGGGQLTADRNLSLDATSTLNSDHAAFTLTAGLGLLDTGTGNLTGTGRTLSVGQGTGITVDTQNVGLNLTYTDDRYLGRLATAEQAKTMTDQNSANPKKIFVGPHPGAGADANTIYFVV